MAEPTFDETIAAMTGPANQRLGVLGAALSGTGVEVIAAFKDLQATLSALPGVGAAAASDIERTRNEDSTPLEYRRRLERERRSVAETMIPKLNGAAHATIARIQAGLEEGLLPKPAKDSTTRLLVRQELQAAMAAHPGTTLDQVRNVIGQNALWDGELVSSDYGRAILGKDLPAIRADAIAKWTSRADGTERMQSSRKALQVLRKTNPAGAVAAMEAAARMHLSRVE